MVASGGQVQDHDLVAGPPPRQVVPAGPDELTAGGRLWRRGWFWHEDPPDRQVGGPPPGAAVVASQTC